MARRGGAGAPLRIATRSSALARWQAEHVAALLGVAAGSAGRASTELVLVDTVGDRRLDVAVWEMGGQGVFVKEVQAAVLDGRADLAVHSAKDLPSGPTPGLVLAAVPERADPRDALVGSRLADLPPGARVATGSVRRRAQLADLRPDLTFYDLRGNIGTRLAKAKGYDAVVVAAAALVRLGEEARIAEVLEPEVLLPQVAQGALGIECRPDDEATLARLRALDHGPSRRAVDAERAYLFELGSGCNLPVGAHATPDGANALVLTGMLATLDGHVVLRHRASGDDPVALGQAVAAHLLVDAGGWSLLADLRGDAPFGDRGPTSRQPPPFAPRPSAGTSRSPSGGPPTSTGAAVVAEALFADEAPAGAPGPSLRGAPPP